MGNPMGAALQHGLLHRTTVLFLFSFWTNNPAAAQKSSLYGNKSSSSSLETSCVRLVKLSILKSSSMLPWPFFLYVFPSAITPFKTRALSDTHLVLTNAGRVLIEQPTAVLDLKSSAALQPAVLTYSRSQANQIHLVHLPSTFLRVHAH